MGPSPAVPHERVQPHPVGLLRTNRWNKMTFRCCCVIVTYRGLHTCHGGHLPRPAHLRSGGAGGAAGLLLLLPSTGVHAAGRPNLLAGRQAGQSTDIMSCIKVVYFLEIKFDDGSGESARPVAVAWGQHVPRRPGYQRQASGVQQGKAAKHGDL